MKTEKEFLNNLSPALTDLEAYRNKKIWKYYFFNLLYFLGIVLFFSGVLLLDEGTLSQGYYLLFSGMIVYFTFLFFSRKTKKNYRKNYKQNIIKIFAEKMYPNAVYRPSKFILPYTLKRSKLFHSDKFRGEDYFNGKTDDGLLFQFSEIFLKKDSKREENHVFFQIKCPGYSFSEIMMRPKTLNFSMTSFKDKLFNNNKKTISNPFVLPDFEESYNFTSDNPAVSECVFSEELFTIIQKLNQKTKSLMSLSFVKDNIYIALPFEKDFLDTNIRESVLQNSFAKDFYHELTLTFTIVEQLSEHIAQLKPALDKIPEENPNDSPGNEPYDHLLEN
jgi:hypothetical protein